MRKYDKSLQQVLDQIVNGKSFKTENTLANSPLKLNGSQWVNIKLEDKNDYLKKDKGYLKPKQAKDMQRLQTQIPTGIKNDGSKKKTAVPVVPYKHSESVKVTSSLSKAQEVEPVYVHLKGPARGKDERKYLTDLTTEYYGEARKSPNRIF